MQRFARFTLVRSIATGGMADVWLALRPRRGAQIDDPADADLVVVKRILRERSDDPRFLRLFLQEGRLSTQLAHPNIVHTFEMGCAQGQYYLGLEYLRGQTVLGLLARAAELRRHIPLSVILRVAVDVAAGLAYAHQARDAWGRALSLVHRDISPSNLFMTWPGQAKILDFGIARADIGTRAPVKGKLPYVAPEQATGSAVDARSDLFSLGVVLHEMLTLRPLFRAGDERETLRRLMEKPVPPPSRLRPGCPEALDALVLALLERDADRRPRSAAELLGRIEEAGSRAALRPSVAETAGWLRDVFPIELARDAALVPERALGDAAGPSEITSPSPPETRRVVVHHTLTSGVTPPPP